MILSSTSPGPGYPAILSAAAIADLIPVSARILLTCARWRGFNPLIVPMYLPWSLRVAR
jgi:hypothetical protein